MTNVVITGSGSYIPDVEVRNMDFIENPFCMKDGSKIQSANSEIIEKFVQITGIKARRYVGENLNCSEIAYLAGLRAIENADIDPNTLDLIIVAHNFGDVSCNSIQTDIVPSLASRVKHKLEISNPNCIPYDIIFGCPGWIQGLIQASMYIKSGEAKRCLVIGSEVLSRVVDPFDRDTMIFADGAGATVVEGVDSEEEFGVISHLTASHTQEEMNYLNIAESYNRFRKDQTKYIKMDGHKIYQYALKQVPIAMKSCIEKAKIDIADINKILIHQANEKMDDAIIKRLYRSYGQTEIPEKIMPMTIEKLGNSSVATVPTLYDLISRGELNGHEFEKNSFILMASVGAGMNINAIVYKFR